MKGLPNNHSKIRAGPRIDPGCLLCQSWSFKRRHNMCCPSILHLTHCVGKFDGIQISGPAELKSKSLEQRWLATHEQRKM